jgi:hypothetical protein
MVSFLLLRSLYILNVLRITAVFISRHLGPVIPTSVYWRRGRRVHSRLHIYHLCGIFCLPWHRQSGKRNLSFASHSKDDWGNQSKVACPRSQSRWSMTSIKPTAFGSRVRHLNHETTHFIE